MRRIDIETETDDLRIEFSYDRSLVQTVKTLPKRRWDPDSKAWFVPFDYIDHVFDTLLDLHFKISQDLRKYCREHDRPVEDILDGDDEWTGPLPVPPDTLTVSDLNLQAKAVLEEAFDESIWLVGELQSYDRTRDWRHAFFELIERPAEDADPVAKIQAVIFQRDREKIARKLRDAPDDVRLRDGLAVRMCGDVELYPQNGSFQIVIRDVDPTYTTGRIQQNRQAILQKLEKKGILEKNRGLAWPVCPLRVGLITSYGSDAYSDFVEELQASGYGFELTAHDAYVQGDRTEESVLEALEYFAERSDAFDVVVIVRGGGARSDLAYFDTDAIGEAICRHPVKVACGIGHQQDVSLLDHVSASLKTPTAAGRALVERVEAFVDDVDDTVGSILDAAQRRIEQSDSHLERISIDLSHRVDRRLNREDRRLSQLRNALSHGARDRLEAGRRRVEGAAGRLPQLARSAASRERQKLEFVRRQLRPERFLRRFERMRREVTQLTDALERRAESRIEQAQNDVERRAERLRLLDPQKVLDRGFAIVWQQGEVVRDPASVGEGAELDVQVAEGPLKVKKIDSDESSSS